MLAIRTLLDTAIKAQLTSPPSGAIATIGAPESFDNRVGAYVALMGPILFHQNVTDLRRTQPYWCCLGYKVKGAEETAERTLADAADAFQVAFYAAKVAGTGLFEKAVTQVEKGDLDFSPSNYPEYRPVAGVEYRLFPFLINVTQQTVLVP